MNNLKEEIWVTKDGTHISVSDMSDEHVRNTLRMLIKQLRKADLKRLAYHHERLEIARLMEDMEQIMDELQDARDSVV